jgi:hypothetical protein
VRRTDRLVDYAARQALNPAGSTNEVCRGADAAAEGAYRLLENDAVRAEAIEDAVFDHAADEGADRELLLSIQDTTTLRFDHRAREELGDIGGKEACNVRGYNVHSSLWVDGCSGAVLGLIDQARWIREENRPGKGMRKKRPYEEKESYKWEAASRRVVARLRSPSNVVTVCDREADIHEFLRYQIQEQLRFVVRSSYDRRLQGTDACLKEHMLKRPVAGYRVVQIPQRGPQRNGNNKRAGRKKRNVRMEVRAAEVTLSPAKQSNGRHPLTVNVVYVREIRPRKATERLEWMLFTTEPISTPEQIKQVVAIYERRELVEDFHKAWKTGCKVEKRRLDTKNLERLIVILAQIAVRLLQLRSLVDENPSSSCDIILSTAQWQCLYVLGTGKHRLPKSPPTLKWALTAIAKLGGWRDTKQTGQIGWICLWRGWQALDAHAIGWRLCQEARM